MPYFFNGILNVFPQTSYFILENDRKACFFFNYFVLNDNIMVSVFGSLAQSFYRWTIYSIFLF